MSCTLLEVVQKYLDRSDGFYVEDINEVDESMQVASIAEEVFDHMYSYIRNAEFSSGLITLEGLADSSKPNYMKLPDNVIRVNESKVWYDISDSAQEVNYRELKYQTPEEFLSSNNRLKSTDTDHIIVEDSSGIKFVVNNKKDPEYFTSFDGVYLVFDSWNSDKESTLHQENTKAWGTSTPTFIKQSDFVIPLPEDLIPLYKDLVVIECYESLRQEPAPQMVQKRARTGMIKLQQESRRIGSAGRTKRYGR